ncbi:hypothetical protein V1478_000088 [Vespula squamosa]|uniref:Uncharacterized protein n=1 Tax=Vespula squamosa TaxID=30214 RepID=A0ABD2C8Z9_VESSQ
MFLRILHADDITLDFISCTKRFQYGRYAVSDTRDVAKKLNVDHKTVVDHLEKIGYKKEPMFMRHMIK